MNSFLEEDMEDKKKSSKKPKTAEDRLNTFSDKEIRESVDESMTFIQRHSLAIAAGGTTGGLVLGILIGVLL